MVERDDAERKLSMSMARPDRREIEALVALSSRIGTNPQLVQGAGGNTSLKKDGVLWIKASGKWLAHAATEDIMVPVAMGPLLSALHKNDPSAEKAQQFVVSKLNSMGLRPSIETTVHALFRRRVVIHVHCVDTISIAVRLDAAAIVKDLLGETRATFVPYARPGLPLAQALKSAMNALTDVAVLGNHGLVVAADTVEEAESLLDEACSKLQQPVRTAPAPDLAALSILQHNSPYRLPVYKSAHGVATDLVSCSIAAGGSLYPDHVVFLGSGSIVAGATENAECIVKKSLDASGKAPLAILFPGKGVLINNSVNNGADEMAQCLADVCSRIPAKARLRYLSNRENDELLSWDAEKYRQILNAAHTGGSA
jgi:rhamnose utilization protein RhaD (predicted bifunctional aldolase and dehydrogenase)